MLRDLHRAKQMVSSSSSSGVDHRPSAEKLQGDQRVLFHFSHPFHMLAQIDSPYLFTCMGCKEYGAGNRFRCQTCCGFDLHDFCALAPPALRHHPFHPDHQLAFVAKTGGGFLRSRCDVCGRATRGFAFRCAASCGFEMHPCCAAMRAEMNFAVHQHPLVVLPPQPAAGTPAAVCSMCQRKRSGGLVYRCAPCGYSLHAACAKDLVNGLFAHGFRSPPEKPSRLSAAARVATQALLGIIGGLIEGIGEGIGEAFVDNIGRGTSVRGA